MEDLFDMIFRLPPKALTMVSVLIGFVLIDDLPAEKQNVLGSFLSLIGDVISTNATNQDYAEGISRDRDDEQLKQDIEELKKQVKELTSKKFV